MKTRSKSRKKIRRRAIANQEMQTFPGHTISNDHDETEANWMADHVIGNVQSVIQQKEISESTSGSKSGLIESQVENAKDSGKPLPHETRSFMESRMGYDFRNVRIHDDSQSTFLNRQFNAQAFATGNDIFFNRGKYNPSTSEGKHLLAHELTHVVQQAQSHSLQKKTIQRQTDKPEWKKAEEKFKRVVVSLDPKKPKSNSEKFKSAVDKTLGTLGKKKVRDALFKKLKLSPKGKELLSVLGMSGYTLYSLSKKKVPALNFDIKVKPNTWLTVSTGGDFKKPKVMIGLKIRFSGL